MPVVMVVDDEPDLRFLLRRMLEGEGYDVEEAPNGRAAIDRIRLARPDLVITDLGMPVMDGSQLIRELRADDETAQIPVVMWSTDPDREADADAVLAKPYLGKGMLEIVADLTGADGRAGPVSGTDGDGAED